MILKNGMSLEQFEDEMQVRVVKYGPKSRPTKQALHFAKQQADPSFFQIATDKINAQIQFLRETYGPSRIEQFLIALRSCFPREVLVTVCLLLSAIIGYDLLSGHFVSKTPKHQSQVPFDVDELSRRMSVELKENAPFNREDLLAITSNLSTEVGKQMAGADWQAMLEQRMQSAIDDAGLPESTVNSVLERVDQIDVNEVVAEKLELAIASVGIQDMVAKKVEGALHSQRISELLRVEVSKVVTHEIARLETKTQDEFDRRISQLAERIEEMVSRKLTSFSDELSKMNATSQAVSVRLAEERLATTKKELQQKPTEQFEVDTKEIDVALARLLKAHDAMPERLQAELVDFVRSTDFSNVVNESAVRTAANATEPAD